MPKLVFSTWRVCSILPFASTLWSGHASPPSARHPWSLSSFSTEPSIRTHAQAFQHVRSVASPFTLTAYHWLLPPAPITFPMQPQSKKLSLCEVETGEEQMGLGSVSRWASGTAALGWEWREEWLRVLSGVIPSDQMPMAPPSCRLQKDLDVSTVHLLQPSAGGFLCRQVGWKTLTFCCLN